MGISDYGVIDLSGLTTIGLSSLYVIIVFLIRLKISGPRYLALASIFLPLLTFELINSPNPGPGVVYYTLMAINIGLFLTALNQLNIDNLQQVNEVLYIGGLVLHLPLLIIFLWEIMWSGDKIIADSSLWDLGGFSVYEVQFGNIIAYQAMVGDPNLVGPSIAIFFYIGMCIRLGKYEYIRIIGNALFFIALFLSNSRGALLSLVAGLVISRLFEYGRGFKQSIVMLVVSVSFVFVAILVSMISGLVGNPFLKMEKGADRRFLEWGKILEGVSQNPWFGNGLGYNKLILGKQAENGYLNLLAETGVLGLFVFLMFAVIALSQYKKWVRDKTEQMLVRPWLMYTIFMLVAMMYTSSEVSSNYWLSLAVVASAAFCAKKRGFLLAENHKQSVKKG